MNRPLQLNFLLLSLLFVIAPFYLHPNIGGMGLALPFNISSWLIAIIFISSVAISTIRDNYFVYNHDIIYCFIFPTIIILAGFTSEVPQPVIWLFRQLYILAGFAFLLALFQLGIRTKPIEKLLYLIVFTSILHGFVGAIQIWNITALESWVPVNQDNLPIGIFQQVNLQATYLVTGLLIMLFLISRPSFISTSVVIKIIFVLSFGLITYVLISTGSRIGILSLSLGGIIMIVSRRQQLLRHKAILLLILIIIIPAIIGAQSGWERAVDKTVKLTEGEYASARQTMYAIGLDLVKNKIIFGYGIGSFPRVWAEQTAVFATQHPNAIIPQVTSNHPHNEILLWAIEGGILSVIGLAVVMIVLCTAIYNCGFSRGGAYLSLLLPISLHTQFELPFYISAVHWFLWLFLIYVLFRHRVKTKKLVLSKTASSIITSFAVLFGVIGIVFLVHADKAQREIFTFMHEGGSDLQVALNDIYFGDFAEKLMMQSYLYSAIKSKEPAKISVFIEWAETSIVDNPELGMFILLSDAYSFVGDKANQCRVAQQGLAIFTNNDRLIKTRTDCENQEQK